MTSAPGPSASRSGPGAAAHCEGCPLVGGCPRAGRVHLDHRPWCATYLAARAGAKSASTPPPPRSEPRPVPAWLVAQRLVQTCPWRVPLPPEERKGCGCTHRCLLGCGDRPEQDDRTTMRNCLACVAAPDSPRSFVPV